MNDGHSPVEDSSYNVTQAYFFENTKYFNKKISVLGDSLSTYQGYSPSDHADPYYPKSTGNFPRMDSVERMYWKQVANCLDLSIENINAYSSSTVFGTNPTYTSFTDSDRLNGLGNPDIIIVEGGTNDIYSGKNSSDVNSANINDYDISKFSEAYSYVIRNLQTIYPNAKIICLTPTFINNNVSGRVNCTFSRINEICDNIIKLADYFGVECIDVRKLGINYSNFDKMTIDGIHYGVYIHSMIAEKIIDILQNY